MSFSEELRNIRRHSFLSQEAFARELNVSFSSVNRWEGGRSKPNMEAMKNIKAFCETHNVDFSNLEKEWFSVSKEAM
ncbi:MAG: helix-turn-helix transcriptional regulator [Spirochaetales bacterium]|nr:helix-turn-helix transcriptional regulator [Spirochaetales bacterium]